MIKKYLSFILVCLMLITSNAALISAQTQTNTNAAKIAEIKATIVKRGTEKKKGVEVKRVDGTKVRGNVSRTDEDSFTVTDKKSGQATSIAYNEVAQVKKIGYSKGDKIAFAVVIGAAATAAIVVLTYLHIYCNNEGC